MVVSVIRSSADIAEATAGAGSAIGAGTVSTTGAGDTEASMTAASTDGVTAAAAIVVIVTAGAFCSSAAILSESAVETDESDVTEAVNIRMLRVFIVLLPLNYWP